MGWVGGGRCRYAPRRADGSCAWAVHDASQYSTTLPALVYYLRLMAVDVPALASLRLYVAGFALATTPGSAGEPLIRSMFLKSYGASYEKTFTGYVSERVSDIVAMLVIASIGLSIYPAGQPFLPLVAIAIAALICGLARGDLLQTLTKLFEPKHGTISRLIRRGLVLLNYARDCI